MIGGYKHKDQTFFELVSDLWSSFLFVSWTQWKSETLRSIRTWNLEFYTSQLAL